jgi:hypothetical protein
MRGIQGLHLGMTAARWTLAAPTLPKHLCSSPHAGGRPVGTHAACRISWALSTGFHGPGHSVT